MERREGEVRRGMGKEEGVRGEGEEEKGMVVGERFETTVSYPPSGFPLAHSSMYMQGNNPIWGLGSKNCYFLKCYFNVIYFILLH